MMVWVGLGSNLGDRDKNLALARELCDRISCLPLLESSIYETPAWGGVAQEPFLNQVIGFIVDQSALHSFIQRELTLLDVELGKEDLSESERSWWRVRISQAKTLESDCDRSCERLASSTMLALLLIERMCGRDRSHRAVRWASRTIDLDLLAVTNDDQNGLIVDNSLLTLPHPRLQERDFVLTPWAELAPSLLIPKHNASVRELSDTLVIVDDPPKHHPT